MIDERLNIPKKLKVGFQKRKDTYSGKLAYVVYINQKGEIAKEKSWSSWRDQDIPEEDYDNVPMEGFVLNKKVGGTNSGWNHRMTKCRVFDPRGFEVEISVENLLYILQECTSSKGKGLEGEFIYAWDRKDLVLLPVCSPDYKAAINLESKKEVIGLRDLKLGTSYKGKDGDYLVYLGKHDWYSISCHDFMSIQSTPLHIFLEPNKREFFGYKNPGTHLFYMIEDNAFSPDVVQDWVEFWKNETWPGHGNDGVRKLGIRTIQNNSYQECQGDLLKKFLEEKGKPAFRLKRVNGQDCYESVHTSSFCFLYKVDDRTFLGLCVYYVPKLEGKSYSEYMEGCPKLIGNKSSLFRNGLDGQYDPWSPEELAEYNERSNCFYENATKELGKVACNYEWYLDERNLLQQKSMFRNGMKDYSPEEVLKNGIPAYGASNHNSVGVIVGASCSVQNYCYKDTRRNYKF